MEGKKISFGFMKTKKVEKPFTPIITEEKRDYIECVEEKSIKVVGGETVTEDLPLVIPMKPNTLITAEKLKQIAEKVESAVQEPEIKEEPVIKEEKIDENETLDQMAVRELMQEARKDVKVEVPDNLAIPTPAKPVMTGEKESTLDDYESVPIQQFGMAMLRGMGWTPSKDGRRVNRVSWRQLEILWEFLISNRCIATAHNRSLQDKEYSRKKWKEIAVILNSQVDGAHKDWAGWTKYWVDYKAKLKKRVAVLRASHVQTGEGPSSERPLTEMEQKFLQILEEDAGQNLPGVPVELPPETGAATIDMEVQDSVASQSIQQNVPSLLDRIVLIPTQNRPFVSILEPLPQNPPLELMDQDPPAPSPCRTPIPHPATTSEARSPRRRRRRREPPMSQEAARRALVRSSQMHAEATVRIADAMEKMVRETRAIGNTATRIERSKYKQPELRPKGLGLGADKVIKENQKKQSKDKKQEELVIVKNSFVKITTGKYSGYYGKVVSLDEDNGRVMVEIAVKKETVSLSEFMMHAVTKSEYDKESKVINADSFEEYKKTEKVTQKPPKQEEKSSTSQRSSELTVKTDRDRSNDDHRRHREDREAKSSNGRSRDRTKERRDSSSSEDRARRREKKDKKRYSSNDSLSSSDDDKRRRKHKSKSRRHRSSSEESRKKSSEVKRDIDKKRKGKKKKRDRDRSPNYKKHRK